MSRTCRMARRTRRPVMTPSSIYVKILQSVWLLLSVSVVPLAVKKWFMQLFTAVLCRPQDRPTKAAATPNAAVTASELTVAYVL